MAWPRADPGRLPLKHVARTADTHPVAVPTSSPIVLALALAAVLGAGCSLVLWRMLQHTRTRIVGAFRLASNPMATVAVGGRILRVNDRLAGLLGRDPASLVGAS